MARHERHRSGRARALWLSAAALALALVALGWWRPWRPAPPVSPRPVALVPTPTPPAPTRVPERIALPSGTPSARPTAPATPATPATPGPAGSSAPGTILYVGTLAGKRGIVAAAADGGARRLLAEGQYEALAWSPDGDRFAAVGRLPDDTWQVAIFAPDGRALARFPFAGRVSGMAWSPDGMAILCFVPPAAGRNVAVWVITEQGPQRLGGPGSETVYPAGWTRDGRAILVGINSAPGGGVRYTTWLVDRDGRNPAPVLDETALPLGPTGDGAALLFAVLADAGETIARIDALDLGSGARRVVIDADTLGARAFGGDPATGSYGIGFFQLAPRGERLAVFVERRPAPGTPQPPGPRSLALAIVGLDGTIASAARLPDDATSRPMFWSPDGERLAYLFIGSVTSEYALRIVDASGAPRASHPIFDFATATAIAWSPDGRWLAYIALDGLTVAAADSPRRYLLAADGGTPAWRPR